jgi:ubiquinone/menaquinone biosynthesis C-methylase UbiE
VAVAATVALSAGQSQRPRSREFKPEELARLAPPDRDEWQQPDRIMDALGIYDGNRVADVGAAGGWFTVRLARRVGPNGVVFAVDINKTMLDAIMIVAEREGLQNIKPQLGTDFDPQLPPAGIDAALMVGVYSYLKSPRSMLANVARSLAPNGRLGIVEYKTDGAGGPGPDLDRRVNVEEVKRDAAAAGLKLRSTQTFLRYQYLLIFGK